MNCPACENSLTETKAGDCPVDVCRGGCGGVWFDDREIRQFDEEAEIAAHSILAVEKSTHPKMKSGPVRLCPKCTDAALCRRSFDVQDRVEIDQCLKCSGIWLDTGELAAIRGQYKTEAERNRAAESFLSAKLTEAKEGLDDATKQRLAEESAAVKMLRKFLHKYYE